MMRRQRRGQTILEYTIIMVVILGAIIAMQGYVKRGIQGRWKGAVDDFGDQYDPTSIESNVTSGLQVNSQSIVTVINGMGETGVTAQYGVYTNRVDVANSLESRTGFTQVGN